ncbi:MAG: hypothetical protein KGH65_02610 [Candidatus Micrarchaeota archaeon]|nr:hypothetical protein [Candidatus Micrarchaeota archaeon]
MPIINVYGYGRDIQTDKIYGEFKQNLRRNMEEGNGFVTGPILLDKPYVGGWKIHVGLGFRAKGSKEETVDGLHEFTDIIQNYSNRVMFKVGTFEKLERLSNPNDEQVGKGITLYIPGIEGAILPWLIMEMRNFVDCNQDKLKFVPSDQCRNFPIYRGGVISMRWASFFSPQGAIQKQIDALERSAQAMCIIAEKVQMETFWSLMRQVL